MDAKRFDQIFNNVSDVLPRIKKIFDTYTEEKRRKAKNKDYPYTCFKLLALNECPPYLAEKRGEWLRFTAIFFKKEKDKSKENEVSKPNKKVYHAGEQLDLELR